MVVRERARGKGMENGGRGPDVLMSATSLNASLAHDYPLSREVTSYPPDKILLLALL